MSFWNLVHGEDSDIVPPVDSSTVAPVVRGAAGAALAVGATAILVSLYSPSAGASLSTLARGLSVGTRQINDGLEGKRSAEEGNRANAKRRIELGRDHLEKLSAVSPNDADVLCDLARAKFACGDALGALQSADRAKSVDISHDQANLLAVFYLLYLHRVEEAASSFDLFKPTAVDYWLLRAVAERFAEVGLQTHAFACWECAAAMYPSYADPFHRQAIYFERSGELAKAAGFYERAALIDSDIKRPWVISLDQARIALREGRLGDASALFERAGLFKPSWVEPPIGQSLVCLQRQDRAAALKFLSTALVMEPGHPQANLLCGNIAKVEGRQAEAQKHWEIAFEADQSQPVPWFTQFNDGLQKETDGRYQEALEYFAHAREAYRDWPALVEAEERTRRKMEALDLYQVGHRHFARRYLTNALECWEKSIELDGSNAQVLMDLGALKADGGFMQDAEVYFIRASKLGHPYADKAVQVCKSYLDFVPEIGPII